MMFWAKLTSAEKPKRIEAYAKCVIRTAIIIMKIWKQLLATISRFWARDFNIFVPSNVDEMVWNHIVVSLKVHMA